MNERYQEWSIKKTDQCMTKATNDPFKRPAIVWQRPGNDLLKGQPLYDRGRDDPLKIQPMCYRGQEWPFWNGCQWWQRPGMTLLKWPVNVWEKTGMTHQKGQQMCDKGREWPIKKASQCRYVRSRNYFSSRHVIEIFPPSS